MEGKIIFKKLEENLVNLLIKIKKKEEKIYIVGDSCRKLLKKKNLKTLNFCCKNTNIENLLKNYIEEIKKNNIAEIQKNITKGTIRSNAYSNLNFYSFTIKNKIKILKITIRNLLNQNLEDDLITRDFTFNALYYEIEKKKIFDPCKKGFLAFLENKIKLINNFEITFEESYNANCRHLRLVKIITEEKNLIFIDDKIKNYFESFDYENLFVKNSRKFEMLVKQIHKMASLASPVSIWNFLFNFKIFKIINPFFFKNFERKFIDCLNILGNLKDCVLLENFKLIFPKFIGFTTKDILQKIFYLPFLYYFFENNQLEFFLSKINLVKTLRREKITNFLEIIEKNFIGENLFEKLSKIILKTENNYFLDVLLLILTKFEEFDKMKKFVNYFIMNKKCVYEIIWKEKLDNLIKKNISIDFFKCFWDINPTYSNIKSSSIKINNYKENMFLNLLEKSKKKIKKIKIFFYDNNKIDDKINKNYSEIENLFLIIEKIVFLEENSQKEINEKSYFLKSKRFEIISYIILLLKEKLIWNNK